MGKNVAVFVDVANIFYAAKAAGVDIDYVTLLKSAIAGRDFVRAYAYTGLDPDNENQRNFHNFLARHDYKVVSKDIRKYGDGKVKANLDIELVVDMMKTARNLDVAIVVSGDGDFAPAIRAVQEMGVRVEVISFRGNTSSDLIDVADLFTDIVQIAKVEKGSSRSGRRVADDGDDLSMTEVPDKLTEGTGRGRGRGTGRGRTRTGEPEPVVATRRPATRRSTSPRPIAEPDLAVAATGGGALVALPGEKLSKAAAARLEVASPVVAAVEDDGEVLDVPRPADDLDGEGDATRRRRRRGGRGRGRGRGRGEGADLEGAVPGDGQATPRSESVSIEIETAPIPSGPRGPRPNAFGSVWDSQIGQTTRTPSIESTPFDIDDEDEPAIPEYLIAEQRRNANRGARPAGRGGRGGAYNSAVDRERYGRGGGGGGMSGGGMTRYPDTSGRSSGGAGGAGRGGGREVRRDERGPSVGRPDREPRTPVSRSDEPWSEVPPELEAILRAQMSKRTDERPAGRTRDAEAAPMAAAETAAPRRRAPSRAKSVEPSGSLTAEAAASTSSETAAPAPKARRAPAARTTAKSKAAAPAAGAEAAATPRRRAAKSTAATADPAVAGATEPAAPKRRAPARKKAESPEA